MLDQNATVLIGFFPVPLQVTKLAHVLKKLPENDDMRIEMTKQLLRKVEGLTLSSFLT